MNQSSRMTASENSPAKQLKLELRAVGGGCSDGGDESDHCDGNGDSDGDSSDGDGDRIDDHHSITNLPRSNENIGLDELIEVTQCGFTRAQMQYRVCG